MAAQWEEVRANWVNGNRSDARRIMYTQSKRNIINTIREAISESLTYQNNPPGTFSGDLKDLYDLLCTMNLNMGGD